MFMGQWSMIPKQIYLRGMNTFVQPLDKDIGSWPQSGACVFFLRQNLDEKFGPI